MRYTSFYIRGLCIYLALSSCTTKQFLSYDREEELRKNKEFEKQVVVQELIEPAVTSPSTETSPSLPAASAASASTDISKTVVSKTQSSKVAGSSFVGGASSTGSSSTAIAKDTQKKAKEERNQSAKVSTPIKISSPSGKKAKKAQDAVSTSVEESAPSIRQPDLEDAEGFNGQRRPLVEPYRVGEKVIHSVRYFAAEAGELTLETRPFLNVNNRKSYNFVISLKTSSLFSKFYSVDDTVETYLDYETMTPHVFKINIRESGKLAQAHSYFDHKTLKANYWEKKYTQKDGEEEIKKSWDLLPFSQNAFSGIFYMRVFQWQVGKEYSFRVSDDEKNVVFKAKALARETLETDAGTFKAIKVKASILSRGALTQAGDLYLWISDDDRKFVLRIEAQIKIGKLVSEVVKIERGQ